MTKTDIRTLVYAFLILVCAVAAQAADPSIVHAFGWAAALISLHLYWLERRAHDETLSLWEDSLCT